MIVIKELNPKGYKLTIEQEKNLKILLDKLNKVRKAWGKPMIITSGLRSNEDQQKLIASGRSNAIKSNHLLGLAADISDPKKELQKWCLANEKLLEEIGLWMEDFKATETWVHFQAIPPKSGKRWFMP